MKILADLHHGQLYDAHTLLFVKRLGHELYRPMGWDWWDKKYYWFWANDDTKQQYLGGQSVQAKIVDEGATVLDLPYNSIHKGITMEHFLDSDFDIILSSTPEQFFGFTRFIKDFKLKHKFIFQMGNQWDDYPKHARNIMNSTTEPVAKNINCVQYYPEFELDMFRRNIEPKVPTVGCFLHHNQAHARELLFEVEKLLPDWKFYEYGANNRNGPLDDTATAMSNAMLNCDFVWHVKSTGDGYGFIVHEAISAGRPVLVSRNRYKGLTAEKMFEDGKTCINVDGKSAKQIALDLKSMYKNMAYHRECCKDKFNSIVDFSVEGENVKKFLETLV